MKFGGIAMKEKKCNKKCTGLVRKCNKKCYTLERFIN